ncbi:ybl78 [Escherichia coli]|uniref:Ybl78 n=1 Tax=Escherichia coli TaxID=562 RepID=A0A376VHR8_ECOLX|nr:ybl78 [Escherichia coli]
MSLLFAERPLVINTQLAMKIGLNEAIVLQQLHYWLRDTNSGMECDGVRWILQHKRNNGWNSSHSGQSQR